MIYTSKKNNFLKYFIITLLAIATVLAVALYILFSLKVPKMDGELTLRGLKEEVLVRRDKAGVVHIEAKNKIDAYKTLGYVQASERLFQMDMARRMAQGELSEIVGSATVESDKLFRNLNIKKHAEAVYNRKLQEGLLDQEMIDLAKAYFDGVNLFISHGNLPVEYLLLGTTPKKFSIVDAYSFIGMMGFSFGVSLMTEPILTDLSKRIGDELTNELRIEKLKNEQTLMSSNQLYLNHKILEVVSFLENSYQLFEGSNAWILAANRTKNKKPILANDPHISFSHPGVWFEAKIKTPDYENYGHYLPAVPFAVLSHNSKRAWGLTMSLTDDMDLFEENIDLDTNSYFFKDQTLPLEIEDELIKVKGEKTINFKILATHHGPVINSLSNFEKDSFISLQWSFYNPENDALSTLFAMDKSKNIEEFKKAVSTGVSPGLNILYADHTNIAHWNFGEVWLKKKGLKRDFILNGSSGEDEIIRSLSFDEKPSSVNPKSGIIVSANERPQGFHEDIRGDWQPYDRYQTILSILEQRNEWNVEGNMELQTLNMNFENSRLLKKLVSLVDFDSMDDNYKEIRKILLEWDLKSNVDSIAPSIFYTWTRSLYMLLLEDETQELKETFAKTPHGHTFIKNVIYNDNSPWWSRFNRDEIVLNSLNLTLKDLASKFGPSPYDWKWGRLHTLTFNHPVGSIWPLNYIFNLGPYSVGGATQEVNNMKSNTISLGFSVQAGPSTRRIIDFSNIDKSYGILPTGNSGHILSPFYKNQVTDFLDGKYRLQLLNPSKDDIFNEIKFKP